MSRGNDRKLITRPNVEKHGQAVTLSKLLGSSSNLPTLPPPPRQTSPQAGKVLGKSYACCLEYNLSMTIIGVINSPALVM